MLVIGRGHARTPVGIERRSFWAWLHLGVRACVHWRPRQDLDLRGRYIGRRHPWAATTCGLRGLRRARSETDAGERSPVAVGVAQDPVEDHVDPAARFASAISAVL